MARKRKTKGSGKSSSIDISGVLESLGGGGSGVASPPGKGGFVGRFARGALPAVIPTAALALLGGGKDSEYDALVQQLQAGIGGESAAGLAASRVGGLDKLMLLERETAAQAPRGTPPATPIVDRLQVLMPELMDKLRQRIKGGLWADLVEGEVLIEAGATSREVRKAEEQQLELALMDELGFENGPPIDARALLG